MKEELLIYLWNYQLLKPNLSTIDGHDLIVLKSGLRNTDSGPDFFNSKIKIDNTIWAGNIEIHLRSSDWFIHKHQHDPAYDNVILHVVYEADKVITRSNGEKIPTLEIKDRIHEAILRRYSQFQKSEKWIPCMTGFENVSLLDKLNWLDKLMVERLEEKSLAIHEELNITNQDFTEVFYRKLARNFGFKTNADAFEQLACSLPFTLLSKHHDDIFQLEALLYGQAGLLSEKFIDEYPKKIQDEYEFLRKKYNLESGAKKKWKFMRMRPANFPTIRISQFAQLIHDSEIIIKILETKNLKNVIQLLKVSATDYWMDHFRFDKKSDRKVKTLGPSSVNLILINTIIPFLFVYGRIKNDPVMQQRALNWLEKLPPEENHITSGFIELGFKPSNAIQSQALIQQKMKYCDMKLCLNCRIGHHLLSSV
jgi:hypothetical protein